MSRVKSTIIPEFVDPVLENQFQDWYKNRATMLGLDLNPNNPEHHYDYRRAYESGIEPDLVSRHWSSAFKLADHPNRYLDGEDTITGLQIKKKIKKP